MTILILTNKVGEGCSQSTYTVLVFLGSVVCPPPPEVRHATSFYVSGSRHVEVADTGVRCADSNITDGNSCHYECREGFRLSGSPILVCNVSAQWIGTVPSCVGKFSTPVLLSCLVLRISRFFGPKYFMNNFF